MSYEQHGTQTWNSCNARNTRHLAAWTGIWLLSTALAGLGPQHLWPGNTVLSAAVILLNLGLGIGVILAYKRHLAGQDELQQRIALEAMALTLGVAVFGGISYEMLEDAALISYQPEISHLLMAMSVTFIISMLVGQRRYQ